ncbi:cytochrome P450 [Byssothecium circinans]|uniref:Cytochrome P450 n=1 Tax=Byssothecium circinans TaxID=147558 RepID=A0A6A5TA90_9PLEO|nr:cytochrome P450 [Byssothecium circinans]
MPSATAIVSLVALVSAILYVVARIRLQVTQDPREPPLVECDIPYITPLLKLTDNKYFLKLRQRYGNVPIFTLRPAWMPKIYVINDPQLIAAVQRQPKLLTFQAISDKYSHLICNLSPTAIAVQKREHEKWLRDSAVGEGPSASIYKAVKPGKSLDDMNRAMLGALDQLSKNWASEVQGSPSFDLHSWVKDVITMASTEAIYGSANPYSSADVRSRFWNYVFGLDKISMGVGRLLARHSLESQAFLADKFEKYFSSKQHLQASDLTRQRFEWYSDHGFPLRDCANIEVGNGIAILTNTVPTAFWLTLHVFSDHKVLTACRDEVLQQVRETKDHTGGLVRTLDIAALKTACPLLQSAFREAMRVHSVAVGMRGVVQEHMLDGRYLLQKDAIIWIPSTVQHFDRERWGADAAEYHHDRFADRTRSRAKNISFRAFGGGTTLCPGRHFAMTEILAFVAMLLLRFEIEPASGTWVVPSTNKAGLTNVMPNPDFDVQVKMRRRSDDEGVKWVWKLIVSEHDVFSGSDEDHDERTTKVGSL